MSTPATETAKPPTVETERIALVLKPNPSYRRLLRITLHRFPEARHADFLSVVAQLPNRRSVGATTLAQASTGEDLGNAVLRAESILVRGARFDVTPAEVARIRATFAPHGLRIEIEEARMS